jgi:5,10-methylenetetrahydromethanopterin reductase
MGTPRFGLAFVDQPTEQLQGTYVQLAEDRGFESAWAVETRLLRDGVVPLASWATRTTDIELGTAMINPYTRTPTLMAQTIATLDEVSDDRTILGIGAANEMLIDEFHGEEFHRPLTRMRETIEVFRALMAGETVTYHGETVEVTDAQLDFEPPRADVPVYMGVTGPRMLKLSGATANGVVLNAFVSKGYIENAMELIEAGAQEADRDIPNIGMVPVYSLDADGARAKETVKPLLAEYVCNLPGLERARRNVGDPLLERTDVREDVMEPVSDAIEADGIEAAAEHVPDWLVDELAVAGTKSECMRSFEEYFDLGFDFLIPSLVGKNYGYAIDGVADHFGLDE